MTLLEAVAVLAAGLAALSGRVPSRLLRPALSRRRGAECGRSWPVPLRPPDPFFLCVLRT